MHGVEIMVLPMGTKTRVTTVEIPEEMAEEIKDAGFTFSGAFLAGWRSIQNNKTNEVRVIILEEQLSEQKLKTERAYKRLAELKPNMEVIS